MAFYLTRNGVRLDNGESYTTRDSCMHVARVRNAKDAEGQWECEEQIGGARRTGKKPLVHTGPRGGKYVLHRGKKCYIK